MSFVTLDWMVQQARRAGLNILSEDAKSYREHANVDDKLYDSRSGLAVFTRWLPRDIASLCRIHHVRPTIHLSALERVAHGTEDYAPGNFAPDAEVTFTPSGNPDPNIAEAENKAARLETDAVKFALDGAFAKRGADLERIRGTLVIARIAYFLYLLCSLAVILAASVPQYAGSRLSLWIVLTNSGNLLYNAVTGQWDPVFSAGKRLLTDSLLLGALMASFAVSGALAYYVEHRRRLVFSRFWHETRHDLSEALKTFSKKRSRGPWSSPSA